MAIRNQVFCNKTRRGTKDSTNFELETPSSTQVDTQLGPLGDGLIKSMEMSGINVESLRKEALNSLDNLEEVYS